MVTHLQPILSVITKITHSFVPGMDVDRVAQPFDKTLHLRGADNGSIYAGEVQINADSSFRVGQVKRKVVPITNNA